MQMKMRTRDSKRKALSIQHSALSKAKAPRITPIIEQGCSVECPQWRHSAKALGHRGWQQCWILL